MIFKIYSPKKLALFVQTTDNFLQKIGPLLWFSMPRQFFRRKGANIAENVDHSVDRRLDDFVTLGNFFTEKVAYLNLTRDGWATFWVISGVRWAIF
jgi:hypothetical protein